MEGPKSALQVENVTLRYGSVVALESINLEVSGGEFAAVIGPSGSGKTSLLNGIAGIQQLTSGRVYVGGRDVTDEQIYKRNIGVVFQGYALFPHMNAYDNVAFPLRFGRHRVSSEQRRHAVEDVFSLLGLEGLEARKIGELSGGQQQRVALARALVYSPELLLLDEPFTALDRMLRAQLQSEIFSLQRRLGVTTLFVTHDIEEAMAIAERIIILRDGKLEQTGTPTEIYEKPSTLFVAETLGHVNRIIGTVTRLEGDGIRLVVGEGEEVMIPSTSSLALEKPISAMVRPERIRLLPRAEQHHPAGLNSKNCLTATVMNRRFLGANWRLDLIVAGVFEWRVLVSASDCSSASYSVGAEVVATWDYADTKLLSSGRQAK